MKTQMGLFVILSALLSFSCGEQERIATPVPAPPQDGISPDEPVVGGKCRADVERKGGKVIKAKPKGGKCFEGEAKEGLFVIGHGDVRERLQENSGSIIFGEGTTECWGPPIPSPPWCVCTAQPCP